MVNTFVILGGICGICGFLYWTRLKGAIILCTPLLIGMGLIYFFQNKLLYIPVLPNMSKSPQQNPQGYRHPKQHNLNSPDISLNTTDGVIIRGWHIKSKQKMERILIYFHQNAGNIGFRISYISQVLINLNCDVILVAYRGYSDSDSVPSEAGLKKDSYAIFDYAQQYSRQNNNIPIYVLGRSLGGAVAINLAAQDQYKNAINGLILQNTFTSISDMIDEVLPVFRYFKFLQRNYWNSLSIISKIQIPTLFIKSMHDQVVPPSQMHRLMNAAKCQKTQYRIQYGTHNQSWGVQKKRYIQQLKQFFKNVQIIHDEL